MSALVALLAASSPGMILLARRVHAARARQSFERFRLRGDPPLAQISDVKVLFFERSGVLTEGRPQVTAVHALEDGWCAEDVLHFAAIAEFKAQHPIREAILRRYQAHSRTVPDVKGFQARPSRGVRAVYQGKELLFGNLRLYRDAGWPEERLQFLEGKCREWSSSGETVLFAALGGEVRGAVCLLDPPRREAEAAIEKLHQLGVRTCLLSGDSPASVEALSKSFAGLEIHAGLLPEEKARRIEGERREGNGLALATLSRESHRIDLQIGRHRLLENELLDVPAALAEARALLGEEKRSLLFLSLYHAVTLPLIASACSLSATSGSLPALAAVLVLAAAAGAFVPPFLLRPRRRSTALPALPVPAPEAGDRQRAREPVGGSV
jgi:Cu+-exporting ATPase